MECGLELKKGSSGHPPFVTSEKKVLNQESQRPNPQYKLRDDKRGISYADLHREITKSVEDVNPKCLENHVKRRIGRTSSGERGLLKYKSYVPSYTKISGKFQDKVIEGGGVGSQDQEKWRCVDKQIRYKSTAPSVSSASTSSSLWTDESSTDSSRGQCRSSSYRRMNHPPLQYYLMSSKPGSCPLISKPSGENGRTFEAYNSSQVNMKKECGSSILPNERFHQSPSATVVQQHEKKDSIFKPIPTSGPFSSPTKSNVPLLSRVMSKTQADDFKKKGEKLEERNRNSRVHDASGKEKTAAVFVPGIVPQKQYIGLSKFYDSKVLLAEHVAEARGLSDRSEYRQGTVLNTDACLSCPFPRESDGNRPSMLKRVSFMSLEKNRFSSERSRSAPRSTKAESSPPRGRNLDRRPILTPSKQSDQIGAKVPSERARSVSPFRRLSFSIGKSMKSSSYKDAQTPPRLSMVNLSSRPSSDKASCSSNDNSSLDKTSATSRGRSSPLRRLLEPLMKPKPSNSCRSPEPLQKGVPLSHQRHVLPDNQPSSSTLPPRNGRSSNIQALFHVTAKNHQPLFSFAVDKEQNITAATMKKQNPQEKDDSGYKYMFFTVQEAKKKSGKWMNQGSKSQYQEYKSNVVAQMRVSGAQPYNPAGQNSIDRLLTREFVLFASASQQTDELAAVVIKIPKVVDRSWRENTSEIPFKGYLKDINATIILPSGIHSLPHKGGPSSLIQRWRSGGACDCGGWDMGCNLRILTNQHQPCKTSCSAEPPSASNGFKLFFQGGGLQDNRPFLSFSPYKDGVYAVEYSSSLSPLQAFSICIAINDGRNLLEISEPKNSNETVVLMQNERVKASSGSSGPLEGEVPARYVSYPPLSPVGRV